MRVAPIECRNVVARRQAIDHFIGPGLTVLSAVAVGAETPARARIRRLRKERRQVRNRPFFVDVVRVLDSYVRVVEPGARVVLGLD